ncbi:RDD family protein [Pseudonocardia acaciae]|uniref:RDD family protein n=1 Tax=Pseudonocardia acaciae TaxID=551276 RepID=UPI00048FEC41|nr:RDD family protein [Pseudonocardia acaciae]
MSDLVTGDAVVLELRLAKLPSRALAFVLDLLVMATMFGIVLAMTFALLPSVDGTLQAAVVIALLIIVFVGYPVTWETLTRGRSLGKLALGLRVVREDGGPISFRHALARGLAGLIIDFGGFSGFTGAVAVVSSLVSPRGRRLGDMLAGTVVVRERQPTPDPLYLAMPPYLEPWAEALDLSRLPDALALHARQFLSRTHELDPAHRATLGNSLAHQVFAHVSPPPPHGTPAEEYLAAVLVTRRRRAEATLAARQPPAPPSPPQPATPHRPPDPPEGFVLPG